jgi:large subunit ribosomal protein L5
MSKHTPFLKTHYTSQVAPALVKAHGYTNTHEIPKIVKVVLNTGIDAEADKNQIADIQRDLAAIAGQKVVLSKSKKAISNFKLREGQVVGAHVTLRGDRMWDFLYRLLAVALPTIRDFRGVGSKLDGQGNYNLGIQDFSIFPEITLENVKKSMGLDITIVTTANTDVEGRELLKLLGMPFRRTEAQVAADAAAAKSNAA